MKKLLALITLAAVCLGFTQTALAGHGKCDKCYATATITKSEVRQAQREWANGIVAIGKAYTDHGNYKKVTKDMINKLYAYNYGQDVVMFKPTKAKVRPFRDNFRSAYSYFIGGDRKYKEDAGFALQPWTKVKFDNDEIYLHANIAIAMGEYYFTCSSGTVTKVEYTFGYIKTDDGHLKIFLHHSSLPYSG